ncbi:unnamed protein product [Linum trigynum]|uniref:Uncharacterized protein n=1 Tax=Linum trigynum TaxID=586398 RepID=A0AAV2GR40_9ROSI
MLSTSPSVLLAPVPDMSMTGRPPGLLSSPPPSESIAEQAVDTTATPLNFKSALIGKDQGPVEIANQWTFVGEHDLIPGSFGGEPSLRISDQLRENLCIPWKKTLVIRLLGRSISYAYLCS